MCMLSSRRGRAVSAKSARAWPSGTPSPSRSRRGGAVLRRATRPGRFHVRESTRALRVCSISMTISSVERMSRGLLDPALGHEPRQRTKPSRSASDPRWPSPATSRSPVERFRFVGQRHGPSPPWRRRPRGFGSPRPCRRRPGYCISFEALRDVVVARAPWRPSNRAGPSRAPRDPLEWRAAPTP